MKLNTYSWRRFHARNTYKNIYKSKFTGCKSIQPLWSVVGGSTFCSNDCYESFWVGLGWICTVRWWNLCHSSHENCSRSAKFDGDRRWTAIVTSSHKCSIGFKSGLWLGHSRTYIFFLFSHSSVALPLCFGSLSCLNVNLLPSFRLMADSSRFSSRILLNFAPSIVPSIQPSSPVPADEKQPRNMMLPPPCLIAGMVLTGCCAVLSLCQT